MSVEDLYKDLAISKEEGVLNSAPLTAFSFPQLPDALTEPRDQENWKILGDVLDECSGRIAILDTIVSELVSASERFRYIGDSVRWMKTELERMCEMPPLAPEEDEGSTASEDLSEQDLTPEIDAKGATPDNDDSSSDASSSDVGALELERLFRPSDMYDWSEIEEDVHLLQEIIIMNPLMAIYEILDFEIISELDLDKLFAQPMLADWDGELVETLLEALGYLSQVFLKGYDSKSASPLATGKEIGGTIGGITSSESTHLYPSPKMTDVHEIRIFELLPGSNDEPIRGLLTIEHLWDDPRYEALSYVWGTSATMKSIQLNETEFGITPNLETALLHLRYQKEPRRLWIDALCINQKDPLEKEGQVKLMSEIYPAAENVLCWLGPEADESNFVFEKLQEMAKSKKVSSSRAELGDRDRSNAAQEFDKEHQSEIGRFSVALFKLLSRPWWSRLWTCQEFALTLRDPKIICGKDLMPWSLFRLAAREEAMALASPMTSMGKTDITELDHTTFWETHETVYGFEAACRFRTESGFVGAQWTSHVHPLFAMALLTRRYRSLDSRDKLFGILSFLLEPHRALFPPNYSQTVATIYTKFSAAVVAVSGGRIYSDLSVGSRSGEKIPTWAFDLSSQTADGESNPIVMSMPVNRDRFSASKGRKTQCIPLGPRLIIRGVAVDHVKSTFNVNNGDVVNPASMYSNLVSFRSLARRRSTLDVPSTDPASKFKHLRAADSICEVMTCGFCNDKGLSRAFKQWVPAGDEAGVPTNVADSPLSSASSTSSTDTELCEDGIALMLHSIFGRKLLITHSGFFGIGVSGICAGDLVVVLFGFDIPMVLRDQGDHFSMIGAARVGGIMEGELMEFVDDETLRQRTFLVK